MYQTPRSWIEEKLAAQMTERPRRVRGHQGEAGNEEADQMAKREVGMGKRMHMSDIVRPAGIRQAYLLHSFFFRGGGESLPPTFESPSTLEVVERGG